MQNLTLQVAKATPVRAQMANQDNGANASVDVAENGGTNPFAQMLKKQVQQKEASANGSREGQLSKEMNAPAKTSRDVSADKTNMGVSVSALDEESTTELQTESTLAPIQDVMLMQMGLQTAIHINPNKPAAGVNDQLTETLTTMPDLMPKAANAGVAQSPALTLGTQPTLDGVNNKVDTTGQTFAQQLGANVANQQADIKEASNVTDDMAGKKMSLQNPALALETNSSELDTKALQTQMNGVAVAQQVSTKALETTSLASTVSANEIPTAFGKPEWNQAVNQKVVWMIGKGEQSATLTLNPPDLGPLKVVIQVDNDHVDTTFISDNPEVRQALEDGMQMLRDKMQDNGMQLGNSQVSSQAQSQRQFEQAMQQRAQQRLEQTTNNIADTDTALPTVQRVANGLVDTFA